MSSDVLVLLREFVRAGQAVRMEDGQVVIGYSSKTPTMWTNSDTGTPYELGVLVMFLLYGEGVASTYVATCKKAGVATLQFRDRKPLLEFLRSDKPLSEFASNIRADVPPGDEVASVADAAAPVTPRGEKRAPDSPAGAREAAEVVDTDERPSKRVARDSEAPTDLADVYAAEYSLTSPDGMLRTPHKDYSSILKVYQEAVQARREAEARSGRGGGARGRSAPAERTAVERPHVPVVVVPQGMMDVLNMWNVQAFLSDGVLNTGPEVTAGVKPLEVRVKRPSILRPGEWAEYLVVDDPVKLLGTDRRKWERLVAVVASGKKWQFADWCLGPEGSTGQPAAVFESVPTFFVRFDDAAVPDTVKEWRIPQILVSKSKGHRNLESKNDLWSRIEARLRSRRQGMAPLLV